LKLRTAFYTLFIGAIVSPAAVYGGTISLQDLAVNVNGTTADYNNLLDPHGDPTLLPGMNASGFSSYTTGDTLGTGLGSLVYTFNPGAAGSYFVNFYLDDSAGTPFYNEFGAQAGAAPAGMSWEIAQVNPTVGGITFYHGPAAGDPTDSTQSFPNTLDNTNHVPAGSTNFGNNCTVSQFVPACNADVALALGFNFVLAAGQQAVITINSSTTNPGGFYLEQSHPVDPNNPGSQTNLFLNGSISIGQAGTGGGGTVPEPGYWPVLGIAFAAIAGIKLRRKALVG
jgi:hypothetical protein